MTLETLNKIVGLPGEALKHGINTAIGTVGNDGILEIAWNVFRRATQKAILTTVAVILKTTLSAMIGYLGPVDSIWKAIIDNPANQELFDTLKKDWWKVANFLVDLLEPMKRFVPAGSINGTPPPEAVRWNDYNELDLSQAMNRHAALSQIQRFFKSIIEVFRQKDLNVGRFEMNTKLETDTTGPAETITALRRIKHDDDKVEIVETPETWLFVNGIAGEFYWNHLSISKLQDFFFDRDIHPEDESKETEKRRTIIKGVFNRSDGILWDLIECAGERRPEVNTRLSDTPPESPVSSRTASSREAQKTLSDALREALSDSKKSGKNIIMIAHSQGCLLLRLTLEEIFSDKEAGLQDVMHDHLHVYTFGNPAYDWKVHAYTASTEHFANELDYVAKLGVLRQYSSKGGVKNDLTYCSICRDGNKKHLPEQRIFVNNKDQSGHLFGSQYSLQSKDYDCVNGTGPSALLSRSERRP
ncbi:hypothetical protein Q7P35_008604 [Cladosporium inversicolor]